MNNCLINTLSEKVDGLLRPINGYVITLTLAKNYAMYVSSRGVTSRNIYGDAMFYTDDSFSAIDGDGKHKEMKNGYLYVKVNKAPCQIIVIDNYLANRIEGIDTRICKFRTISAINYQPGVEPLYVDSSDLREMDTIVEVYLQSLASADGIVGFDIRDFGKCIKLGNFFPCGGATGEVEELLQAMYDNGRRSGTLILSGSNITMGKTNITYQGVRVTKKMKFQFSDTGWEIV